MEKRRWFILGILLVRKKFLNSLKSTLLIELKFSRYVNKMFKSKMFRRLIILVLTSLIILGTTCFIYAAEKEIVVLSFNDFHGSLAPSGKNVGAAKLADALKTEKAKNPEGTIIVSAGDSYQGSAMSNLLYGEPVSAVLKEIGG